MAIKARNQLVTNKSVKEVLEIELVLVLNNKAILMLNNKAILVLNNKEILVHKNKVHNNKHKNQ